MKEANHHVTIGCSQYEFLEEQAGKVDGEASRCLEAYLKMWNWKDQSNPNAEVAVRREADRQIWREYYSNLAAYGLGRIHHPTTVGSAPIRPDLMQARFIEPPDLEEFILSIVDMFKTASASFYNDVAAFRGTETLLCMTTRFLEVAEALMSAGHMTSACTPIFVP